MRNTVKFIFMFTMSILFLYAFAGCSKKGAPKADPLPSNSDSTSAEDPSSAPDSPTLPVGISKPYKLVWQDEFDGQSVDAQKWNYRADGTVRNLATVSKSTISLDGQGHLAIRVTKDTAGNYFIGELGTQGLYEAKYGYFECRAKMNTQIGPHVAFWLQSSDIGLTTNDPARNGAEIDIFEYHRKKPTTVFQTVHWNGYGAETKSVGETVEMPTIGTGFHTFGLEWTNSSYRFFVDGKMTWSTNEGVSRRKEYIILSTELTGWGGDPTLGHFPDSVVYDYVRVYAPE